MEINYSDREYAIKQAERELEKSDLKQHANKMLRAFENFNDFSSNRAIWELVQNACDLTTSCEITIDYRNGQFAFTHNGNPFTSNSLISLVKQVSGDKDENSEIPPVGKYGTGFLTTHSLGRKILVNGLLSIPGGYTELKDFVIDRRAKECENLIDQIQEQKDNIFEIIRSGKFVDEPIFKTTFTYLPETEQEKRYVHDSFKDLEEYIPIVLAINNRLKSITIISETNDKTHFVLSNKKVIGQNEVTLYKTCILKNGNEMEVHSITDVENKIEVILPIDKDLNLFTFSVRVARLFLYYPLVGSEDFGVNFIINCNCFLPTEPRNGIHLHSNNDQVKDQEIINRKLISSATDLIFSFLNSNILPVTNPLLYARINFKRNSDDQLLNEYFTELQTLWIERFKSLEIVKTQNGYKKVEEVAFVDPLLLNQTEYFDCIYYLLNKFYSNIPEKTIINDWSTFVHEWQYEKAQFVSNINLAEQLNGKSLDDLDKDQLLRYYYYLTQVNKSLFTDFKLIPNIYGKFEQVNLLKRAQNIDPVLLEIGGEIIPSAMNHLVHEQFILGFNIESFSRRHFWNEINTSLNELVTETHFCLPIGFALDSFNENVSQFKELNFQALTYLLEYCKLSTKKDSKSRPARLLAIISEYYGINNELVLITPVADADDELDLRIAQRKLVKVFFNTLFLHKESWVKDHVSLIFDIISCYEDRYKDVYLSSRIYPNQLFKLKLITELKKDIDLTLSITELYNKVLKTEIEVNLAVKIFNEFLVKNEEVTNKDLAAKIEEAFFCISAPNINEHPFKGEILKLIPQLNQELYKNLFPRLYDKRASLMLEVVTNENTKDDIFLIVTLDEGRLKQIGQLIQHDNIDEILKQAQEVIRLENEKRSDFAHKYAIGTYIEDHIRQHVNRELSDKLIVKNNEEIEVGDVQGGQDIVIFYNEEELYYIEVKSRWDPKNSVSLSKLQLEKASLCANKYALISVDVTKYEGTGDKYKLSIEEILPLVRVLSDIGSNIQPLIQNNLVAELDHTSKVKLIDYRGLVNQDTINAGQDFQSFSNWLIEEINNRINCFNTGEK